MEVSAPVQNLTPFKALVVFGGSIDSEVSRFMERGSFLLSRPRACWCACVACAGILNNLTFSKSRAHAQAQTPVTTVTVGRKRELCLFFSQCLLIWVCACVCACVCECLCVYVWVWLYKCSCLYERANVWLTERENLCVNKCVYKCCFYVCFSVCACAYYICASVSEQISNI